MRKIISSTLAMRKACPFWKLQIYHEPYFEFEGGHDDSIVSNHDPYYPPIVSLPEVEVKTGDFFDKVTLFLTYINFILLVSKTCIYIFLFR